MSGEKQPQRDIKLESRLQYGEMAADDAEEDDLYTLYPDARRQLLKYAEDARNIWHEIIDDLELSSDTDWLDIASSRGHLFLEALEKGHRNYMLGIDLKKNISEATSLVIARDYPGARVEFDRGDAENLLINDGMAKRVTKLFAGYHLRDQAKALEEARRVLADDGRFIVATRDPEHQEELWKVLSQDVAPILDAEAPLPFYVDWPVVKAKEDLKKTGFEIVKENWQDTFSDVPGDKDGLIDIRNALISLGPVMRLKNGTGAPRGSQIAEVVDSIVLPKIAGGGMRVRIKQWYAVCLKA